MCVVRNTLKKVNTTLYGTNQRRVSVFDSAIPHTKRAVTVTRVRLRSATTRHAFLQTHRYVSLVTRSSARHVRHVVDWLVLTMRRRHSSCTWDRQRQTSVSKGGVESKHTKQCGGDGDGRSGGEEEAMDETAAEDDGGGEDRVEETTGVVMVVVMVAGSGSEGGTGRERERELAQTKKRHPLQFARTYMAVDPAAPTLLAPPVVLVLCSLALVAIVHVWLRLVAIVECRERTQSWTTMAGRRRRRHRRVAREAVDETEDDGERRPSSSDEEPEEQSSPRVVHHHGSVCGRTGRRTVDLSLHLPSVSAERAWSRFLDLESMLLRLPYVLSCSSVVGDQGDGADAVLDVRFLLSSSLRLSKTLRLASRADPSRRTLSVCSRASPVGKLGVEVVVRDTTTERPCEEEGETERGEDDKDDRAADEPDAPTAPSPGCKLELTVSVSPVGLLRMPASMMDTLLVRAVRTAGESLLCSLGSDPTEQVRRDMKAARPLLEDCISSMPRAYALMGPHLEWLVDYTTGGGKMQRSALATLAFDCMCLDAASRSCRREIGAMAWVLELLQAAALVEDDIMDGSSDRRGKPCWYKQVGQAVAINDGVVLLSLAYRLIDLHVGEDVRDSYRSLIDEVVFATALGQGLDTLSEGMSVDEFSEERYESIVEHKTSLYTFWAPLFSGIVAARLPPRRRDELVRTAWSVSLLLGDYFHRQNDYLDCFGDPEVAGSAGRDIRDGKCTWLAVRAMSHGTEDQKQVMRTHYGRAEDESVAAVRTVYDELDLCSVYAAYEEAIVSDIEMSLRLGDDKLRALATQVLGSLHGRRV